MKCVFGEAQDAHAPGRYLRNGTIVEDPESPERVRRLLDGAGKAGLERVAPRECARDHLGAVHSARYLDFLANGYGEWLQLPGAYPEIMPSVRPLEPAGGYPDSSLPAGSPRA